MQVIDVPNENSLQGIIKTYEIGKTKTCGWSLIFAIKVLLVLI